MLVRIISILGSFASLSTMVFMVRPQGQTFTARQGMALGIGICFLIVAIFLEIKKYYDEKPLTMTNTKKIRDYMYNWISRSGRTAVFSRDLSWVSDDEMKEMLFSKAGRDELCICLPNKIPLVEELENAGAEVCSYSELDYIPQSRFTIRNWDRADAQVAVGGHFKGKHIIREFSAGSHPYFSVVSDLVKLIQKFDKWKEDNKA